MMATPALFYLKPGRIWASCFLRGSVSPGNYNSRHLHPVPDWPLPELVPIHRFLICTFWFSDKVKHFLLLLLLSLSQPGGKFPFTVQLVVPRGG